MRRRNMISVGDRVKVVPDITMDTMYDGSYVSYEMTKYAGDTVTIRRLWYAVFSKKTENLDTVFMKTEEPLFGANLCFQFKKNPSIRCNIAVSMNCIKPIRLIQGMTLER